MAVVIAHYRENLDWISLIPSTIKEIIVYHKGGYQLSKLRSKFLLPNDNRIRIYSLPNIGREGHTFLYHIINNYNHWNNKDIKDEDRIIFLQGNPLEHSPYLFSKLFQNYSQWETVQPLGYQFTESIPPRNIRNYFDDGCMVLWMDGNLNHYLPEKWTDPGIQYLQKKYRKMYPDRSILENFLKQCYLSHLFVEYMEINKNNNKYQHLFPFTYGGLVSVTINQILKQPLDVYNNLVRGLFISRDSQGGLEGYLLERIWLLLWRYVSKEKI